MGLLFTHQRAGRASRGVYSLEEQLLDELRVLLAEEAEEEFNYFDDGTLTTSIRAGAERQHGLSQAGLAGGQRLIYITR